MENGEEITISRGGGRRPLLLKEPFAWFLHHVLRQKQWIEWREYPATGYNEKWRSPDRPTLSRR